MNRQVPPIGPDMIQHLYGSPLSGARAALHTQIEIPEPFLVGNKFSLIHTDITIPGILEDHRTPPPLLKDSKSRQYRFRGASNCLSKGYDPHLPMNLKSSPLSFAKDEIRRILHSHRLRVVSGPLHYLFDNIFSPSATIWMLTQTRIGNSSYGTPARHLL